MFKHLMMLFFLISVTTVSTAQFSDTFNLNQMEASQGLKINAIDEFAFLGRSVSHIGDFNNDGKGDVVVGAPGYDFGRAYVIYGGSFQPDNPLSVAQITGGNGFILKGNPGTGISVSAAGDYNGDGIDDLLVAAGNTFDANMAIAYVLFGTTAPMLQTIDLNQMAPTEGIKFNRPILNETPGYTVSRAGDFNHDGFDDILIGSVWSDDEVLNGGTTYLVYGNNTLANSAINLDDINGNNGISIFGVLIDDPIGGQLASAGDFNGDQFDDILISVGANLDNFKGHTYLIFGSQSPSHPLLLSNINGNNGVKFIGDRINEEAGRGLAGNFDFNADGRQDIIIGAPSGWVGNLPRAGKSYVVFGTAEAMPATIQLADIDGSNGVVINGLNPNGRAGESVSAIGDFNGDQIDDVIIGGPAITGGWSFIIYGSHNPPAIIDMFPLFLEDGFRITGLALDNRLGDSVSSAGDFNGDGLADVLIGAWFEDVNQVQDSGTAYILYGNDTLFVSGMEAQN